MLRTGPNPDPDSAVVPEAAGGAESIAAPNPEAASLSLRGIAVSLGLATPRLVAPSPSAPPPVGSRRLTSESTHDRLLRLNLPLALPLIAVAATVVVALDVQAWWHAVVLGLGVGAGLLAFIRWAQGRLPSVANACLAVTAVVWPVGVLAMGAPNAYYGLAIVGSLVAPRLSRYPRTAALALVAYVALVGALRLPLAPENTRDTLVAFVLIPAGVTLISTAVQFPNKRFYDLVYDLEETREQETELAVARERIRFAGDLHDIQGHTLHVVKLKVTLAEKLVEVDPARARAELTEIHALVKETIAQTKELAYAQRRLNLNSELENARNLFEAAGIRVRITREGEVLDARAGQLLGQVLRESTTNILRHAEATQVRITLSAQGVSISNDGAAEDAPVQLRGLATLRQRLAEVGGELTVERKDGQFATAATFGRLIS